MSWQDSLLPPDNTSPWEYAVEGVSASFYPFGWAVLRTLQSPQRIPADKLPLLAWAFSVDVWHGEWPEEKKRAVTASAHEDHRLVGTIEGIRRYLAIEDDRLVDYLAPPQRFFASAPLSKVAQDAWLDALPQLRIFTESRPADAGAALFADDGFADDGPACLDEAPAHYGRFPVLRKDGVDIPLDTSRVITTATLEQSVSTERISIPGVGADTFADDGFADDVFTDADVVAPLAYTVSLDQAYVHETSELALDQATPGFDPIDVRFETDSLIGDAAGLLFADDGFADDGGATDDGAEFLIYRMVRLNDPAVMAPVVDAVSFADATRLFLDPFTLELLVDANGPAGFGTGFEGMFADDELFLVDEDPRRLNDALDAIVVSKGVENRALVSFETVRNRKWGDGLPLDGSVTWDSVVPNSL